MTLILCRILCWLLGHKDRLSLDLSAAGKNFKFLLDGKSMEAKIHRVEVSTCFRCGRIQREIVLCAGQSIQITLEQKGD